MMGISEASRTASDRAIHKPLSGFNNRTEREGEKEAVNTTGDVDDTNVLPIC